MERRNFLKLAFGTAAGAAAFAASAQAGPVVPFAKDTGKDVGKPGGAEDLHPAVTSRDEVEHLAPEQVGWGHHPGSRRRGWRRPHWRRRHWRRW